MTNLWKGIALLAMLAMIQACANIGRQFDTQAILQIKSGETSQGEVLTLLGEPWRKGLENGLTTWTYANYHYSAFKPLESDDLFIKFDDKNVVKSYTFNTSRDTLPQTQLNNH